MVILKFQNYLLCYIFCLNFFKIFSRMSILWRHIFLIKWSMTLKVIQGHMRPHLCQNHSSTFVYEQSFMKILWMPRSWRHIWLKIHFYVMEKFCYFSLLLSFWSIYNLDLKIKINLKCPSNKRIYLRTFYMYVRNSILIFIKW